MPGRTDCFALDRDGDGDAVSAQFIARSEQINAELDVAFDGWAADNLELIFCKRQFYPWSVAASFTFSERVRGDGPGERGCGSPWFLIRAVDG